MIARFAVAAFALAAACHQTPDHQAAATTTERIVHGTVSVTGTSFEQQIMLDTGHGSIRLRPSGAADSAALTRLGGIEVSVRGTDDAGGLRVRSFTAQRVGGKPVVDGYVRADGARLYLETTNGNLTLGNPPAALRQMIGARIWIGGPLDRGPNEYGVIVPR